MEKYKNEKKRKNNNDILNKLKTVIFNKTKCVTTIVFNKYGEM